MKKNILITVFASIMVFALVSCTQEQIAVNLPSDKKIDSSKDTKGIRTIISTRAGDLTLSYADGKAVLQGTLERSTPCVNWEIDAIIMESFPEQVKFSIEDKSTAQMCVQVLGKPEEVFAQATVSDQAKIMVLFKEEVVYEGQLE